jgi:hypothetical protein
MIDTDCLAYIIEQRIDQLAYTRDPAEEKRLRAEIEGLQKRVAETQEDA